MRRVRSEHSTAALADWKAHLQSRRRFLLSLAGGSLAALMPVSLQAKDVMDDALRWRLLDAVQNHLFPSEPDAPGAQEIQALRYLKFVVADAGLPAADRAFILRGPEWLQDLTLKQHGKSFLELTIDAKQAMLLRVAASETGENWISTLQLYICEALLADPVYGGNPGGVGWKWLGHDPGFPRPNQRNRYGAA